MSHTLGNWCVGSSLSAMVVANGKENRTRKLDLSSRDGKVAREISQAEIVSRGLIRSSWWMGSVQADAAASSQQQVMCHEQKRPRHMAMLQSAMSGTSGALTVSLPAAAWVCRDY